jgi:hypothetical protein
MIVMNECFLANAGSKYGIDLSLPLRLQKRALLKALGFPGDPKLKGCRVCEADKVKRLFKEYSTEGYPFLIIVSEKPMHTPVPPLFVVNGFDSVQWRDDRGTKQTISADKALAVISRYPQTTWVEFTPRPWNEHTIAGRLIYTSMDNQVLEIQQGIVPAKLINDRQLPTYVGELSFLEATKRGYLDDSRRLREMGYLNICSFGVIRSICRAMPPMSSFEELRFVSRLPTLEFAFTETGRLMAIDIDWPAQYVEKKGGK